MAQVVMISAELKRKNNEVGDIVDIYDGTVELGPAYDLFTIKMVPGTAKEVWALLEARKPEVKEIDAEDVWFDAEDKSWKKLKAPPKHDFNFSGTNFSTAKSKIRDNPNNSQKLT